MIATETPGASSDAGRVDLDPQHQLFVDKYFELSFNQTKAAIAAGFSKRSAYNQGYRLMKNDEIRKVIDQRLEEMAMGKHEVLARLSQHASGDMREFIDSPVKNLSKHPNGNLIKKFKLNVTTTFDYEGLPQIEEKIELELYDAQAALVQLGKYHKLFVDRTDLTTNGQSIGLLVQGVMDGNDSDALAEPIP